MMENFSISHEFVDFIPPKSDMDDHTLYIAIEFATASHKCFCGCGNEVVTPISPVGWKLIYDGETVSLSPSVGSWSLDCQSHYWIRRDVVEWALPMSPEEIAAVRRQDDLDVHRHYAPAARPSPAVAPPARPTASPETTPASRRKKKAGWLSWLLNLIGKPGS